MKISRSAAASTVMGRLEPLPLQRAAAGTFRASICGRSLLYSPSSSITANLCRSSRQRLRRLCTTPAPLTEEDFFLPLHERRAVVGMPLPVSTAERAMPFMPSSLKQGKGQRGSEKVPHLYKPSQVTSLDKAHTFMAESLGAGRSTTVIYLWDVLKRNKITPNATTYKFLLRAYAEMGLSEETFRTVSEMEAISADIDLETFHTILLSLANSRVVSTAASITSALQLAARHDIQFDTESHKLLALAYARAKDFRRGRIHLNALKEANVTPPVEIYQALIQSSAPHAIPQPTIELIAEMAQLGLPLRSVDIDYVIRQCVSNEMLHEITGLIDRIRKQATQINTKMIYPVLVLASSRANWEITAQIGEEYKRIAKMEGSDYTKASQFAYEAVVRSQALAVQFPLAFQTINEMYRAGCRLSQDGVEEVVNIFSRNTQAIDEAFSFLENARQEGSIDSDTALKCVNLIIDAYSQTNHFAKAFEMFASIETLGLKPDINSYHAILRGVSTSPGYLSTVTEVYDQLAKNSIKPTSQTFHFLISAFLVNQQLKHGLELLSVAKDMNIPILHETYAMLIRKMHRLNQPLLLAQARAALTEAKMKEGLNLEIYLSRQRILPSEYGNYLRGRYAIEL